MRLKKLREVLVDKELDAILVSQADNRRYLSGFTGSAGTLLITAERAILATDFRYFEQMGREAPDFELAKIETRFPDLLPGLVADLGVQRLGFESQSVTVDELRILGQGCRRGGVGAAQGHGGDDPRWSRTRPRSTPCAGRWP